MAMSEQEIIQYLSDLIVEYSEIPAEAVTPQADLRDDLDIDSLSAVEIIVTATEKFDVEISDSDLKKLRTVQDVITYVQRLHPSA